jgi:hypothetical protein
MKECAMITIKLDTATQIEGLGLIDELKIETPVRVVHLLTALQSGQNPSRIAQMFMESICGLPSGGLGQLTLEDYVKVSETINPLLAPFERLLQQMK